MASPKPILTSNGVYRKVGGVKKAPHALVGQKINTNSNPVKPKKVTPAIKVVNEKITVNYFILTKKNFQSKLK